MAYYLVEPVHFLWDDESEGQEPVEGEAIVELVLCAYSRTEASVGCWATSDSTVDSRIPVHSGACYSLILKTKLLVLYASELKVGLSYLLWWKTG